MHIQKDIAEFIEKRQLLALPPVASVASAVELMKTHSSDCVLVCEGQQLCGIFTQRDFLRRVVASDDADLNTPLREVMTARPSVLRPTDSINYAINQMAQGGYRNVPIVDGEGDAVTNLSVRDVMRHLSDIFAELDDSSDPTTDPWVDIGGG